MCWKVILVTTCLISSSSPRNRRSPLEIGYVQFTTIHHHPPVALHLPSVVVHNTTPAAPPLYREQWIPGHVLNHVFVPGRVQHVLLPVPSVVVLHPVPVPVIDHTGQEVYRKHYGGFGVGVDYGGRGAGHGFHVVMGR